MSICIEKDWICTHGCAKCHLHLGDIAPERLGEYIFLAQRGGQLRAPGSGQGDSKISNHLSKPWQEYLWTLLALDAMRIVGDEWSIVVVFIECVNQELSSTLSRKKKGNST
jgi:hypothetical protein